MIFIQPYYYWNGHYKIYTESLFKNKNDYLICVNTSERIKKKNVFFKKPLFKKYDKNLLTFISSRILNFFLCFSLLLKNKKKFYKHDIHFLEFEPISLFFFLMINFFLKKKIIFTIHSTSFYNKNNTILFFFQRIIFYFVIYLLNFFETKIIVHKKEDKNRIQKIFKKKIFIFEYPSKKSNYINKKFLSNKSLLIIGQIRKDKDIEELVDRSIKEGFNITIAGQIYYNVNYWYELKRKNKIKLMNKYLTNKTIENLIKKNDFIFIPYGRNYSGSAGPLKDSLSYGQPVICSNLMQFNDIIKKYSVGFIFNRKNINKIKSLKLSEYQILRKNCLSYVKKNNFENFYSKIVKIY